MIHRQAIGAQFLGTYREKQRQNEEQWLPHRAPLLQRGNRWLRGAVKIEVELCGAGEDDMCCITIEY